MLDTRRTHLVAIVLAAVCISPAGAQTIAVTGNRENVNRILDPPSGRCVPTYANTVIIAPGDVSSSGTSNLGSFTSTQSHCVLTAPPTPFVDGVFEYRFEGGDSIFGTYSGDMAASAVPGVLDVVENLTVTGGTGRFVGANGTITDTGTLRFGPGPVGIFASTLSGGLTATATTASGAFATALGAPSAATGDYATALGALSLASAQRSLAVGSFAEATAVGAVAVGDDSLASGVGSIAAGQRARATGALSIAVGSQAEAANVRTTSVGTDSRATGLNATAVGNFSAAGGMGATAVGNGAAATNVGTLAAGVRSSATGDFGTALGRMTVASAANATALGANSAATFAGSTAIGAGATTTAANQVALGAAGSSVRVGDVAASTAAQAGAVNVVTVDGAGTLGRGTASASLATVDQVGALATAATALTGRVDTLFDLRRLDRRDMRQGIAAAVAMGQASMPSAPGRTAYVLNGTTFRGEFAVGGSILHRLSGPTPLAIGAGFSFAGNKNNAARVGVTGEF